MCRLADQGNLITELNLSEKHCGIHMLIRVQYCYLSSLWVIFIKGINAVNVNSSMTWMPGQYIWCILNMNNFKHALTLIYLNITETWQHEQLLQIMVETSLLYYLFALSGLQDISNISQGKKKVMEPQSKDLVTLKIRYIPVRKML